MGKVEYAIETEQVTIQNLIVYNKEENEKLLQITLDGELFKIIVLKKWEKKIFSLSSDMVGKVEIIEIT